MMLTTLSSPQINPSSQTVPPTILPSSQMTNAPILNQPTQQSRTQIREEQDREYQASLRADQFKDLEKNFSQIQKDFNGDPLKDFESVLNFYKVLKTFSFGKNSDTFPQAIQKIDSLIKETEQTLNLIIQKHETSVTQSQQPTASTQGTINPVFAELKEIIAQLIQAKNTPNGNVSRWQGQIQPTFNKLQEQEKKLLLTAFNQVLKQENKIKEDLSENLCKQPLALWGTLQLQGQNWNFMVKALGTIANPNTTALTTTAPQNKVAEMKQRMQEVQNAQPTQSAPPRRQTQQVSTSSLSAPQDESPDEVIQNLPFVNGVLSLKSLLALLKSDGQTSQLQKACQELFLLDARSIKCSFNGQSESNIADRPFFHLYLIHKNEAPQKLKNDMQYGNRAFAGEYEATNNERTRAVQRALAEVALKGLEEAINFQDGAAIVQLLDVLEEIKLDPNDRVNGQDCIAYNLYGMFYHEHVEARKTNTSLVDPSSPQFNGDFGRHGMRSSLHNIDPSVKLATIAKAQNLLKTAWKV